MEKSVSHPKTNSKQHSTQNELSVNSFNECLLIIVINETIAVLAPVLASHLNK